MDPRARTLRETAAALRRFERWEREHHGDLEPGVALRGVGFLWRLLPAGSRERPLDPGGVERMRRTMAVLR